MTWERSTIEGPCGSCRVAIAIGAPILRVTDARLVRCKACAKQTFNADPPTHWPVPEADRRQGERRQQPFATPSGWASSQRERFDHKLAQAGE